MPLDIEGYAIVGDTHTAALVGLNGSIDWLCLPRFDSGACFAALLGNPGHGRWLLAPSGGIRRTTRRYRDGTLVLETDFETEDGSVRILDFMPHRHVTTDLVRIVEGRSGRVPVRMELAVRFDYGSVVPWVRRIEETLRLVAGPNALCLRTPVRTRGENLTTVAEFSVGEGERVPFVLTWHPSFEPTPPALDTEEALGQTEAKWREWSSGCRYDGPWRQAVVRSLITLKALTYEPTGGMVAAATTSLPEQLGGVRNWDYRYCWLRDATFTLHALTLAGYVSEARAWRDWLLTAVAGDPAKMQIMYGAAGERRFAEFELDWLPGYQGAAPVRVGNPANQQFQLDVYGEVMDALHEARRAEIEPDRWVWALQRSLMDFVESHWADPDNGIWEVRGPRRHFTHSRVMAWVALDRAVKAVERFGLQGPIDRWRRLRERIHQEVCDRGYDRGRRAFTQSYGSKELDASLLMISLVGFLPPSDERVATTVEAIQRELCHDGLVLRYSTEDSGVDGLPPGEGAFLACTFWLVDNLALLGRHDEAGRLFERLVSLGNDVGLMAEEYDVATGRMVGNFPQAFTHVGLVNSAFNLSRPAGVASNRAP